MKIATWIVCVPMKYCNRICLGCRRHSTTICGKQACPSQMLWRCAWLCRPQRSCQYCNSMAYLDHGPLPGNIRRCRCSGALRVSRVGRLAWLLWFLWRSRVHVAVQLFGVTRGCAQQLTIHMLIARQHIWHARLMVPDDGGGGTPVNSVGQS